MFGNRPMDRLEIDVSLGADDLPGSRFMKGFVQTHSSYVQKASVNGEGILKTMKGVTNVNSKFVM